MSDVRREHEAEVLHIVDWDSLYEVNTDGRQYTADGGKPKRKTKLDYVRWHVLGPGHDNQAYCDVADYVSETWDPESWLIAYGVFAKLVELAANRQSDERGYLLGRGHRPLTVRAMERVMCFTASQIALGIQILLDEGVKWLELRPLSEVARNSAPSARLPAPTRGNQRHGADDSEEARNPAGPCQRDSLDSASVADALLTETETDRRSRSKTDRGKRDKQPAQGDVKAAEASLTPPGGNDTPKTSDFENSLLSESGSESPGPDHNHGGGSGGAVISPPGGAAVIAPPVAMPRAVIDVNSTVQIFAMRASLPTADGKQRDDDLVCFASAFHAANTCANALDIRAAAMAKAIEVASDVSIRPENRARVLVAWFKRTLTANGAAWGGVS